MFAQRDEPALLIKGPRKRFEVSSNEVERFKKRRTGLVKGRRETADVSSNEVKRLPEETNLPCQRAVRKRPTCRSIRLSVLRRDEPALPKGRERFEVSSNQVECLLEETSRPYQRAARKRPTCRPIRLSVCPKRRTGLIN
ncbi:MAG: hypothetical protein DRR08_11390 [Candidatus Parabeggiatoa sp. nov. 2]|nr:MAG: hypothetical protein DRR08_11390 [Gammaproteobacteria bacterium]